MLKENMEERAERLALYIIENRTTVRAAAQKFGISKSTVHTVVTIRVGFIGLLTSLTYKYVLSRILCLKNGGTCVASPTIFSQQAYFNP